LFEGKSLLERHRMINEVLAEELAGPVHALAITALSEQEAAKGG
jgi:BolA protein